MNPRRRWFLRLMAAAFSAVLAFALLEGLCRLTEKTSPFEPTYTDDPHVGFRPTPRYSDGIVRITENGFRDDEPVPVQKPANEIRVLFLGDSFLYAAGVATSEVVTEKLEARLAKSDPPDRHVRVINAGCPGYSTERERLLLEHHGLALAPDLVVVGFFVGNDVMECASDDRWHVKEDHSLEARHREKSLKKKILRSSALYRRLMPLWNRDRDAQASGATDERYHAIEHLRLEQWRKGAGERPPLAEGWQKVEAALTAIRDRARVPVLVAIFPDEVQVDEKIRAETVRRASPPIDLADYDLDSPQRRVQEICTRLGLAVVDLLPVFRERGAKGGLYRTNDTHWNEAGHALAAETILPFAKRLLGRPGLR